MSCPNKDDLLQQWRVSRETVDGLEKFIDILYHWQQKLNLVAVDKHISYEEFQSLIWQRHILDSLQLLPLLEKERTIIDIGSGAGFPGLMLAISTDHPVWLIESDTRKCEFLKEVARQLQREVNIINQRVENISTGQFPKHITITSRACAKITKLLELTQPLHPIANFLLLKGEQATSELDDAALHWRMAVELIPSFTNEQGSIISIRDVLPHATP